MDPKPLLRSASLLLLLLAQGMLPTEAQTRSPSDTVPADGGEPASPQSADDAAPPGAEELPQAVPLPEPRPSDEPPVEQPEAPAGAPNDEAAPNSGLMEPSEPAEEAAPAVPPAYVSPEEARTSPAPGAPETPDSEITPAAAVEAAAAIEDARLCEAELEKRGAIFTVGTSISEGDCGVLRPLSVTRLSSGVEVSPQTQLLCRTALALDIWTAEGLVKAAAEELDGERIASVQHASTYVCRDRASESRISEHSRGSAFDLASVTLADGRTIAVRAEEPGSGEDRFWAKARVSACGPFKTVLGPGTDADHADHFHLDIAARNGGATYCR